MGLDVAEKSSLSVSNQQAAVYNHEGLEKISIREYIRRLQGGKEDLQYAMRVGQASYERTLEKLKLPGRTPQENKELIELINLHRYYHKEMISKLRQIEERIQHYRERIDPNNPSSQDNIMIILLRNSASQQPKKPIKRQPTAALAFNQSACLNHNSRQELAQSPD